MTRRAFLRIGVLATVMVIVAGAFATVAHSRSAMTFRCDRCHTAAAAFSVAVTESATDTATVTYTVTTTQSGAAWAVFAGTRRITGTVHGPGSFKVERGRPYDVIVVGPLLATGHAKVRVAPPSLTSSTVSTSTPDAVAPSTSSDARAVYGGPATITLTARDNDGGWGLAYVYHRLDGGPVRMTTLLPGQLTCSVTVPSIHPSGSGKATHRLEYWSQDNYGNVESPKQVTFAVQRAALTIGPSLTRVRTGAGFTLSGTLTPGVAGEPVRVFVKKPGSTKYAPLATVSTTSHPSDPTRAKWRVSTRALKGVATYYAQSGTARSATVRVEAR